MALYDGFFDGEPIPGQLNDDGSQKYDRQYEADDFTTYFKYVIGSGVCVHNNPDSFRVYMSDGKAVVMPGYLFIEGYWLRNDADYIIPLPGNGNYAIVARLNLGKRMIELEAATVDTAYSDSLVLAIVSPTSANDTRYNTDLCGVIDTAGELSKRVEWVLNYIDNEIESKLAAIERDIAEQSAKLDAKIAEVQAVADSIIPPPVGSIKFSASKDVGEEWLPCDGRFVNEKDYPELVEALGKLIPSGDKFQLLSDGEIGPQISNGVVYDKRMWVYSYATGKLYGVDLYGGETKEVALSSDRPYFSNFLTPSTAYPICLSIVPHKNRSGAMLFLAQRLGADISVKSSGVEDYDWTSGLLLFQSEFTGNEKDLKMEVPFAAIIGNDVTITNSIFLPYVVSTMESGEEKYLCAIGSRTTPGGGAYPYLYVCYIKFSDSAADLIQKSTQNSNGLLDYQRSAFSAKSKGESAYVHSTGYSAARVDSIANGTFSAFVSSISVSAQSYNALNIVGQSKMISAFTLGKFPVISLSEQTNANTVSHGLNLPSAARVFVDAGAYLWGKDIYMIFVGTGIIFSRMLEEGSFGYLDTTSVLGAITQFGYLDYSEDEGTLYLMGQDTTNSVKVAKIVLNTLYDYANDGAWLPTIAADGVPAYIKALPADSGGGGGVVSMQIKISVESPFGTYATILFNGEEFPAAGTFTRKVEQNGTFTVGLKAIRSLNYQNAIYVELNGTNVAELSGGTSAGNVKTVSLPVNDYITNGITLTGKYR